MSPITLVIPDIPLRDAVAEQLTLAGCDAVKVCSTVQDALALPDKNAIIIADEVALDKKALTALGKCEEGRPHLFLLGTTDAANDELITESFAKPLRLGHLLARLKFYLETAPRLREKPVVFGPFRLEPQQRRIVADNGDIIRLTEKETALLEYLGQSSTPVTREELLAAIWGYDAGIDTHTLETHIYQLRSKLDPSGASAGYLVNEQGAYRLVS